MERGDATIQPAWLIMHVSAQSEGWARWAMSPPDRLRKNVFTAGDEPNEYSSIRMWGWLLRRRPRIGGTASRSSTSNQVPNGYPVENSSAKSSHPKVGIG